MQTLGRHPLAVLVLCSSACSGLSSRSPADLSSAERSACVEALTRETPPTLLLAGVDRGVRRAIDDTVRAHRVVALRLESRECNATVEVVSCSMETTYETIAPDPTSRATEVLTRPTLSRGGPVAGAATLLAVAGTDASGVARDVEISLSRGDARRISPWLDLSRARQPSRFGPMRPGPTPTLFAEDLGGRDCSRVTHWAREIDYGAYRALAGSLPTRRWDATPIDATDCQPPACREPIALTLATLPSRRCPPGSSPSELASGGPCRPMPRQLIEAWPALAATVERITTRACPIPAPGQPTEQAAQVARLFEGRRWLDAALAAERVANGETGDDVGNRRLAEFMTAVSCERLGMVDAANAALARIAATQCDPRHDEAAFWIATLERRRSATKP